MATNKAWAVFDSTGRQRAIEALQRAAGLPTAPEAAPMAADGWVECAPGECPADLRPADRVRWRSGEDTIVGRTHSGETFCVGSRHLLVTRESVTAYRRSAT